MKDFWLDRWKANDAPWNLAEPEPLLIKHFPKGAGKKVLVPLCGKSVDMLWLKNEGHQIFGVELSPIACHAFFEETKIPYRVSARNKFQVYESDQIHIFCGDIFELVANDLPVIDAVYDRAALIALPEKIRTQYAKKLTEIVQSHSSTDFFMLTIAREDPGKLDGPPFNISSEDIRSLFAANFKIEKLESAVRPSRGNEALSLSETVYRIVKS